MKRRAFFLPLFYKLAKVFFSNISNKEREYKKIIFYHLKELGGIYIKFLQVLCMNQNFMEGWGTPKEMAIFNQATIEPLDIEQYIAKENFSTIESAPFASGSFALVYKGILKTKEKVVIKILRPSIVNHLEKDLKKLKIMLRIVSSFLPKTFVDYNDAFLEFYNNCLLETDYETEIENMKYFEKFYDKHPYIVIPKVYENLSNKQMIVQEYIEGPTLADVMESVPYSITLEDYAHQKIGSDINFQIVLIGGEALRTAMVSDYVFGDPHPGNIILLPKNKIAFIDFGIVAHKPSSQEAFYHWVKSYYAILIGTPNYGDLIRTTCTCFCPDLVNALSKCTIDNDFFTSMENAINKKLAKISDNSNANHLIDDGHLFKVFTEFIDGHNAFNLKVNLDNFQLLRAMQMFLSTVNTLAERYGTKHFNQIMIGSMHYALSYCEKIGIKKDMISCTKYSVNESYELLLEILSSLAQSDDFLFENICERMFL